MPDTAGPTVSEVLDGVVPTLVVHRSWNYAGDLPDLVARAQAIAGAAAGIGIAVRLPKHPPHTARAFLDGFPTAALRIADPEVHTLPGRHRAPHAPQLPKATQYRFGAGVPDKPTPAWVSDVLDAQHAAGANVLLSASGWVDSTNGAQSLADAMAFVAASRAQLGADDPMFVNLTLHQAWLRNPTLRNLLLEELIESREPLWWVRVMWPPLRPSAYSQATDADLLDGYKDLADTARDEGKTLLLPNSGLTGWVATALGASGFSTGMSGPERAYLDQAPQNGAPPTTRDRFFDENILNTVLRTDRPQLDRQSGYNVCACHYCPTVRGSRRTSSCTTC